MRADIFSASPAAFTPLTADGPAVRTTRGGERSGQRGRVVVIDADRRAASGTAAWLCTQGWHASAAGSVEEARGLVARGRCDAWVVVGMAAARGAVAVRQGLPLRHAGTALVAILPPQADASGWDVTLGFPAADDLLLDALDRACRAPRFEAVAVPALPPTPDAAPVAILGADESIRPSPAGLPTRGSRSSSPEKAGRASRSSPARSMPSASAAPAASSRSPAAASRNRSSRANSSAMLPGRSRGRRAIVRDASPRQTEARSSSTRSRRPRQVCR